VRRPWESFFILLRYYVEGKDTTIIPQGYVTEEGYRLGEWVAKQRQLYKTNKLSSDHRAQLEQLRGWVWDRSEALWQEGYKHIREYSEREGHTSVPIKYVTNDGYVLGEWLANQRRLYKINNLSPYCRVQLEQLKGWVWGKSEALWQEGYKYIREYSEREGHTLVHIKYRTNGGYKLGLWVFYQRQLYNKNKLSSDHRTKLTQLKGWVWGKSEALWQKGLKYLREYYEHEGHALVQEKYRTNDGYHLGLWIKSQRQAYLKGELSMTQQQALESLPGWTWPNETKIIFDTEWPEGFYELLCEYVESKGHSRVPIDYVTNDGYWLGRWVVKIRRAYRLNRLSQEQQRVLEKLAGWEWQVAIKDSNSDQSNPNNNDRWSKGYEYLLEYIKDNHNSVVLAKYVTNNGFRLGTWVQKQRLLYKRGRLKADRRKKLDRIAKWFWSQKEAKQIITQKYHRESSLIYKNNNRNQIEIDDWRVGLQKLSEFVHNKGHTKIPHKYVTEDGFKLGIWTRNQRGFFSRGELSEEHQKILEKIQGWYWNQHDTQWLKRLEYLLRYIRRNGNTLVPKKYVEEDGYKLGLWVMSQRERYKHKRLSAKRRQILEGLPSWTWAFRGNAGKPTAKWYKGLEYLKEYIKNNGNPLVSHRYVTKDGFKLGIWVRGQRYLYRIKRLSEERKTILGNIPDWKFETERVDIWGKAFERLKLYVKQKGTSRVHQYYKTEDGYGLGTWVHRQRRLYKKGEMSSKQIELFEQLPDWVWDGREAHWSRSFKLLQKYAQEKGHANVPSRYKTENGYCLGSWVAINKELYRDDKLSKERQNALEQMPGWTWGVSRSRFRTMTWSEAYEYLKLYSKVHHLALMTINYVTDHGYPLGKWASHQRNLYRKGKLLLQHQKALEKLPAWSWGKPTISWSKAYEYLKQYSEVRHHSIIPINYVTGYGYRLGKWVDNQRYLYKKGRLSLERQKNLEQILNWSWVVRGNQPK